MKGLSELNNRADRSNRQDRVSVRNEANLAGFAHGLAEQEANVSHGRAVPTREVSIMGKVCMVFTVVVLLLAWMNTGFALCVKIPAAKLRVGPGTEYEVGWIVSKYFPLKKVGTSLSGEWYAVADIDGDVFWIQKSLVTSRYRCGAVRSPRINVRRGPGIRYGRLFSEPVERYYSFKILEQKGAWIRIADIDGNIGWVQKGYCRIQ